MSDDKLPKGLVPFNGFKKLNNVLTPISLGPVPATCLKWLDKHVYGLLRFIAKDSDRCRVMISGSGQDSRGNNSLTSQLRISEDSVGRSLDRLAEIGLIYRQRSRNEVLVIFLESRHLYDSWPKETRPAPPWPKESPSEPADVRVLNSHSEPADVRVVGKSKTRKKRLQNPQKEAPEPAGLRVAYKESLGTLGTLGKRKGAAKSARPPKEKTARAHPPFSDKLLTRAEQELRWTELRPLFRAGGEATRPKAIFMNRVKTEALWRSILSEAQQTDETNVWAFVVGWRDRHFGEPKSRRRR